MDYLSLVSEEVLLAPNIHFGCLFQVREISFNFFLLTQIIYVQLAFRLFFEPFFLSYTNSEVFAAERQAMIVFEIR